jgi:hypothetical protein
MSVIIRQRGGAMVRDKVVRHCCESPWLVEVKPWPSRLTDIDLLLCRSNGGTRPFGNLHCTRLDSLVSQATLWSGSLGYVEETLEEHGPKQ